MCYMISYLCEHHGETITWLYYTTLAFLAWTNHSNCPRWQLKNCLNKLVYVGKRVTRTYSQNKTQEVRKSLELFSVGDCKEFYQTPKLQQVFFFLYMSFLHKCMHRIMLPLILCNVLTFCTLWKMFTPFWTCNMTCSLVFRFTND